MTKTENKTAYILRLTLTLFIVTAVTAALLGLVNSVTADKIAEITRQQTDAAMLAVMEGCEFGDELSFTPTEETSDVAAIWPASKNGEPYGYVVQCTPSGFGGEIDMMVGVSGGAVTGVSIIDMSETAGLGTKATTEPWFLEQFKGLSGTLTVKQDIDALTGATITSKAITSGVNEALAAVAALG